MNASISSTALAAMRLSMQQLDAATSGNSVAFAELPVAMAQATAEVEINAQVIRAADEMVGTLLDMLV